MFDFVNSEMTGTIIMVSAAAINLLVWLFVLPRLRKEPADKKNAEESKIGELPDIGDKTFSGLDKLFNVTLESCKNKAEVEAYFRNEYKTIRESMLYLIGYMRIRREFAFFAEIDENEQYKMLVEIFISGEWRQLTNKYQTSESFYSIENK